MFDLSPEGTAALVIAYLGSKAGIIFAWCVLIAVLERLLPVRGLLFPTAPSVPSRIAQGVGKLRRRVVRFVEKRTIKNLILFGINGVMNPLIVTVTAVLTASLALAEWRPTTWPWYWHLCLDILLLDLMIYWSHRAFHRIPLLWRFHVVHHLDETLDVTTALRFHFGEVMISAVFRASIVLAFDVQLFSVVVAEVLLHLASVFHHSKMRLPPRFERLLSRIIVTPSIHWVHHHRPREDTDSNYGNIFSFWDVLFRTRSRTRRHPRLPIGVEGLHDRSLPVLLLLPFLPRARWKKEPANQLSEHPGAGE